MILRWFGSLGGRLTLFIVAALVLAQIIAILTFVRTGELERSEQAGENFVRQIASLVRLFEMPASADREAFLSTARAPGMTYWISDKPAVIQTGVTIGDDGPRRPGNWRLIASPDKRLMWFGDRRPIEMRYQIAPVPITRNLPNAAREQGPPRGPEGDDAGPPEGSPQDGLPPPPEPLLTAPTQMDPALWPPPDAPYGAATSMGLPYGKDRDPPPVRWRAAVKLSNGQWLNAEHLYELGLPPWLKTVMYQNMVTLALMVLLIVPLVGFATLRLTQLARAADRLGRGEDTQPLPESGSNEIVRLTQAFNQMSLRLRRFVQGRTQMLAGISHDLRTPITALRLRADLVDEDENRERMLALIDDMHHLTEATLTLARDDSFTEKSDIVDVSSLVEGVCDDLTDAGVDAVAEVERGVNLTCRPYSLRRAIRNLAENGAKYGKRARITMNGDAASVHIIVDDDGPGIPDDMIEKAFQPFVRLESSRSRETGGSGLGLAITRSIVLNHGGDISLKNRPGGGLRAVISLPKPELV